MLLEVTNLNRTFGTLKAVDDLSFTVESGRVCGFVGPNGAGKTTTMRIITSVEEPTSGEVRVAGHSVIEYPERTRSHVGYMPDAFPTYPNLTTEEYLEFFAGAYGLRGKEKRERLATIFDFLQLETLRTRPCNKLSKGMTQRLCLARTLVHDPKLLILDEPAAGLDPRSRIQLRELLTLLAAEGKGVLVSSHILTELSEICDAVVIIERGRLTASGTVTDIMERLKPHVELTMQFACAPHEPVRFLLEQPHVVEASGDGTSATVTFTGKPDDRAALLTRLVTAGFAVTDFRAEEHDLEDLFLSLTDGDVQ